MGSIKQKGRTRRQRKRVQHHKRSILLICAVIIMLVIVISINGITLQAKNKAYKHQEEELLARIEEEDARTKEVEAFKDYVNTQAYTEVIAKDKLGLVYPNEIIFKPQK